MHMRHTAQVTHALHDKSSHFLPDKFTHVLEDEFSHALGDEWLVWCARPRPFGLRNAGALVSARLASGGVPRNHPRSRGGRRSSLLRVCACGRAGD